MLLVMNQADTYYTQKVHEMENRDSDYDQEEIELYVFPVEGEDKIKVSGFL